MYKVRWKFPGKAVLGIFLLAALVMNFSTGGARAELSVCNDSQSQIAIAVGYKEGEVWVTEGWWNLKPDTCEPILQPPLNERFYYLFARDWDTGGDWGGATPMCTQTKVFTIRGVKDCVARGFIRSGFSEIDTGDAKKWTVRLSPKSGPDG